ncbi:MAG: glycosyltransferase [Kangiellaceae bacterium]
MKILAVGAITNEMNGSSRSFIRLCNLLSRENEVNVVLPNLDGVADLLIESINKCIVADISPIRRSFLNIVKAPFSIVRFYLIVRKIKPDVIHINDIPWFYLILVAKVSNVPVTIHSRYIESNRFLKKLISLFLERADKVIFVSDYNKKLWNLNRGNKCVTIHNPGVFDFVEMDLSNLRLPKKFALIVSRISEDKGIIEVINSYYKLSKIIPDLCLVIAGDYQYNYQKVYKKKCELLVSQLELDDKVIWLGKIDKPHSLYKGCAVYYHLPNFEDPFPTTIMEGLSLNSKIITNCKGGIPEQVEGFSGVFILRSTTSSQEVALFVNDSQTILDRTTLYKDKFGENAFVRKLTSVFNKVVE